VAVERPSGIAATSSSARPVCAAVIHTRPPRALRKAMAYGSAQSARATKPPVMSARLWAPIAASSLIASLLDE
jgi:hypothetical protein